MSKFAVSVVVSIVLILGMFSSAALAQPAGLPGLSSATAGVPYNADLFALFGLSQIFAEASQDGVSLTIATSAGSALPPGLSISATGVISGTPTTPGDYTFTVNFAFVISVDGMSVFNETVPVPLEIVVGGVSGPPISVDPSGVSFSLGQGDTTAVSKSILIANNSETAQSFTASASASSTTDWLSVSPTGGSVPFGTTSLSVTVNPSGLNAGAYTGAVALTFTPSGQSFSIPVVATVNSNAQGLALSQTGFRFQTSAGGGTPPPQTLSVLNSGTGSLPYSASVTTLSGASWLSISPSGGTATHSRSPMTISVDPTGLAEGTYYGQVHITSTGASNSPQVANVVLDVAAAGQDLGALVQPTGVIFVTAATPAGGTNPPAQTVTVTTPDTTPLAFSTTVSFQNGSNWFSVTPANSSVSASNPVQLQIQPLAGGLPTGVYIGDLALYFSTDQTIAHVAVLLIVIPSSGSSGQAAVRQIPHASTCNPSELVPVFTLLGSGFSTVAAWPTPLAVTVVDDCGNLLTSGSVVASFSTGDPAISLLSLGNGSWTGTWQPEASAAQATITVQAQEQAPALVGTASIGGSLESNPTTPIISPGGAVSAASLALNQPLAPGSFVSIFGANLSAGVNQSETLPLATQLGATQVVLAGQQLPLQFVGGGQVNAIIPYDVPVNTTMQMVVMNGPAISMPQAVVMAPAQPAVFTVNQSGQGAGIVVAYTQSGTNFQVDADHPMSAGDVAVIYCAGLGPVNPPVPAGTAAPSETLSHTANPVTVTIGGVNAPVQFAGLAPTYTGLYQINATVPTGIKPGASVPMVITVAGQQSTPVTVNIK